MRPSILFAARRAVFMIAGLGLAFQSCNKAGGFEKPVRKDITQVVYASGKVLPQNRYTVVSRFPGYIEKIYVKPGQIVEAGDPLISVSNDANEYAIRSAENLLQLAEENADVNGPILSGMKEEVEAARSKYILDSINYNRTAALYRENATSRMTFDQSETALDLSRRNYFRANDNYNAARKRYQVEFLNAKNQAEAQRSNRSDYRILAAVSGKVYDVIPEVGDLVTNQTALMEIGDASAFEVELSVDETDISLIRPEQVVAYAIDAYPDRMFSGKIREVIPRVLSTSKSSRVFATFETDTLTELYSGMSVEANIVIREKKNCLVIPREFVKGGNQVLVKGEEKPRIIKKGLEDMQFIEVLDGLKESDELMK